MKPFTNIILKLLRYFFLLASIAGAVALCSYLYVGFFAPSQTGEAVTLSVRQLNSKWAVSPLAAPTETERAVAAGQPAQYVQWGTTGGFVYRERNPATRLLLRLIESRPQPVPYVLATLLFCVLVYRILRDIRPGVPFTAANVRRLRFLGLLLIGCDLYHWTISWWLGHYLAAVGPAGLRPTSPFGSSLVANWLIGLMLLIVAAGYQRGVELAEDAELTV